MCGLNKRFERITRDHSVAAKDIIYEIRYPLNSLQQATRSLYIHFGQNPFDILCQALQKITYGKFSFIPTTFMIYCLACAGLLGFGFGTVVIPKSVSLLTQGTLFPEFSEHLS